MKSERSRLPAHGWKIIMTRAAQRRSHRWWGDHDGRENGTKPNRTELNSTPPSPIAISSKRNDDAESVQLRNIVESPNHANETDRDTALHSTLCCHTIPYETMPYSTYNTIYQRSTNHLPSAIIRGQSPGFLAEVEVVANGTHWWRREIMQPADSSQPLIEHIEVGNKLDGPSINQRWLSLCSLSYEYFDMGMGKRERYLKYFILT